MADVKVGDKVLVTGVVSAVAEGLLTVAVTPGQPTIQLPSHEAQEVESYRRRAVPQDISIDLLDALDKVGTSGTRGNTLWAMTMDLIDEVKQLRSFLSDLDDYHKRNGGK